MKRYLLFVCECGYESYTSVGGWNDFEGDFDSLDEAEQKGIAESKTSSLSCFHYVYQVVDTETKEIVKTNS